MTFSNSSKERTDVKQEARAVPGTCLLKEYCRPTNESLKSVLNVPAATLINHRSVIN